MFHGNVFFYIYVCRKPTNNYSVITLQNHRYVIKAKGINRFKLHGAVWGWSGGAKVLCILRHQGVQLILAYSWARPATLVAGKGRGRMFLFLLFLHFHSQSFFFPVSLFHLFYFYYLFYLFSLSLGDDTK